MKEIFPVIHSTLSAHSLSEVIRQKYQLSKYTQCKLFRAAMNHLYIVSDGTKKFVFRVYTFNWRTKLEIEEELRLLNLLRDQHTSVAYPISDKAGKYIQEFEAPEGKRFGVMFTYAPGNKSARFSEEASFLIGKNLARMHQATELLTLDRLHYNSQTLITYPLRQIRQFFNATSEEIRFMETLSAFIKAKFDAVDHTELHQGVVHLDVWFDNMHIDDNQQVTFFDFDFCGNGYLCLDISYFLYQLFYTHPQEKEYQAKADSFLKGYTSERKISRSERGLLPYACLAIMIYYISIQCERFDYWTNIFVNEDHLKRNVANMRRWMRFHAISIEL